MIMELIEKEQYIELILQIIIPFLLIIFGLIGNITIFFVFSLKTISKFPIRNLYRALAVSDTLYLLFISIELICFYCFDFSLRKISNLSCKITRYLTFFLGSLSAWLLVYISINKYILIRFNKNKLIQKNWFQCISILVIFFYNLVYYSPAIVLLSLKENYSNQSNDSNVFYSCVCDHEYFIDYMDLMNFTLLPFFFMIIFSIMIIITIFRSRLRILRLGNIHDRNRFKKDIKFAISSILLNIFFVILNLPLCIGNIIDSENEIFNDVNFCVFLSNFCVNFYILIFSNSIFRKEFSNLFK
jgi:hypothetical protein